MTTSTPPSDTSQPAEDVSIAANSASIHAMESSSGSPDTRPLVVAICMASAVAICSLLLVFGICLLDSITSYEFGSVQTIVLVSVLCMMNVVVSWLFVATAGSTRSS